MSLSNHSSRGERNSPPPPAPHTAAQINIAQREGGGEKEEGAGKERGGESGGKFDKSPASQYSSSAGEAGAPLARSGSVLRGGES